MAAAAQLRPRRRRVPVAVVPQMAGVGALPDESEAARTRAFPRAGPAVRSEWLLLLSFAPAAGVYPVLWFRRWQEWEHYRTKVKPLALALSPVLDQPAQDARSWLDAPQDYATRQD